MAVVRDIEPWDELLQAGREDERLVMQASQHPRPPQEIAIPEELHPEVAAALRERGIDRLWAHQAEALHAAWAGPTIVTTGTASGKSLCFNLPTLDTLCRDARARALYLYPTKALAQDQARALNALGVKRARPAIYDGDTPREQRLAIRRRSNIVITNPDMLHLGILPNHPAWGDFFANLAVVVVDEAHVYRGVFGSHVANVLRRLRRVADAYGTAPRILLASATVANPGELAERLTGLDDITVVDRDGAPAGQAHDRDVEPADRRREDRRAPLGAGRGGRPAGRPRDRGRAHDRLHEVAQGGRADVALRPAHARRTAAAATWPTGSPPTAPATRRSSGASSSTSCSRASCSAWWPPTRSSSASTSARSTRRSA